MIAVEIYRIFKDLLAVFTDQHVNLPLKAPANRDLVTNKGRNLFSTNYWALKTCRANYPGVKVKKRFCCK
jgi:hypothetical protein